MGSGSSSSRRRPRRRESSGGEGGSTAVALTEAEVRSLDRADVPESAPRELCMENGDPLPRPDCGDEPAFFTSSTQERESNRFPYMFQTSDKTSQVHDTVVYDSSEQDLMASIEREYCS